MNLYIEINGRVLKVDQAGERPIKSWASWQPGLKKITGDYWKENRQRVRVAQLWFIINNKPGQEASKP